MSVNEGKTSDGASYLELKVPKNAAKLQEWNFLEKYGYRYGDGYSRPLLPSEVSFSVSVESLHSLNIGTEEKLLINS